MITCREDSAWLGQHLRDRLAGVRFPLTGTFELTLRCNLRCAHCYLGPLREGGVELSTEACRGMLDQLAEAGCLSLALTGGEPLVRPDFPALWTHAHGRGFLLSLFTNGTLLDEETVALLAAHPPLVVEVSLYGADEASYAAITGDGGAFPAVVAGIDRLRARGVPVALKAVLLAPLARQIEALREVGRVRGLEVRLDPGVNRTLDGGDAPTRERLPPAEAVAAELAAPARRAKLRDYARAWRLLPAAERTAPCAAGYHAFHVDPAGRLMACMLLRTPAVDAARVGFAAAWRELGQHGRVRFAPGSRCATCELGHLCGFCPPLARLGEEPDYHCEVARERKRVLDSNPAAFE